MTTSETPKMVHLQGMFHYAGTSVRQGRIQPLCGQRSSRFHPHLVTDEDLAHYAENGIEVEVTCKKCLG